MPISVAILKVRCKYTEIVFLVASQQNYEIIQFKHRVHFHHIDISLVYIYYIILQVVILDVSNKINKYGA